MKLLLPLLIAISAFGAEKSDIIISDETLQKMGFPPHVIFATNELPRERVEIKIVLSTNWLPMTLQQPNGDGTCREARKEVGIVVSNCFAQVVADNSTNKILLSSQVVLAREVLLRDEIQKSIFLTNSFRFDGPVWTIPIQRWTNYTNNTIPL